MTAQLPSRERLQEIIDVDARCNPEVRALACFALAAHEQEPVAYMIGGHYLMHADDPKVDNYTSAVPLYTHPAPSIPAVPDELMYHDKDPEITKVYKIGWNACRAAMLNGGKS